MEYLPKNPCRGCATLISCEQCVAAKNYDIEIATLKHFVECLRDEPYYTKFIPIQKRASNGFSNTRIITVKTGIKKEFIDTLLEDIEEAKRR
jgi:hypothetical protein